MQCWEPQEVVRRGGRSEQQCEATVTQDQGPAALGRQLCLLEACHSAPTPCFLHGKEISLQQRSSHPRREGGLCAPQASAPGEGQLQGQQWFQSASSLLGLKDPTRTTAREKRLFEGPRFQSS